MGFKSLKAPFLNYNNAFPLVTVPSGKIANDGIVSSVSIRFILSVICLITLILSFFSSRFMNIVYCISNIPPSTGIFLAASFAMKPGANLVPII